MTSIYSFRPFLVDDLELAWRWLQTPEVIAWWGDPEEQLALLREDLGPNPMRQWIVACGGRPFAYVQAYPARAWPQPHLAHLPDGTEAIDTFIGEPDMLGAGHGARYLRVFAEMLLAEGAAGVVIDSEVENARARRAYARAGFVEDGIIDTPDGPALVMRFRDASSPPVPHPSDRGGHPRT